MMELKSFLLILLMLASWTQQSDGTDCTLYTSSQPPTLNLLCPNSICRLRIQYDNDGCNINSDGCIPSCYIDNCNREYHLCNTTQNLLNASDESSPSWMSRGGQTVYNNTNCTLTVIPMNRESVMRCQKGDCSLTAQGNIDACSSDLGIDCDLNNYEETCIRTYNFCITSEHQPTTCQPSRSDTTTSGMSCTHPECTSVNQCTETEAHTTTIYKPAQTPSTVYVSVCPSLTKSIPKISTTNVLRVLSSTNTRSPSPTTCSPSMNQVELVPLNIVAPATGTAVGLLIVLLLAVTTGWVCTCWIINRGKTSEIRSQNISNVNISETALNIKKNPAYETKTPLSLQRNLAYTDTTLSTSEPENSHVLINIPDPTYEVIPAKTVTTERSGSQEGEDEYDRLNRQLPKIN